MVRPWRLWQALVAGALVAEVVTGAARSAQAQSGNSPGKAAGNTPAVPPASANVPVVPPVRLSKPDVTYPIGAVGDATVVLHVTVGADGHVRDVEVVEGPLPFSARAADTVKTWIYDPATRNGVLVAAKIAVEIRFLDASFEGPVPAGVRATAAAPATAATPDAAAEDVVIRGAHHDPSMTASLSRAEVREIPGTFGDPFRAIEIMPGVTPIVSGLPYFFVRGAPPGDVGYYLDGVRVPYLFHVGAGPSVIQPGLVDTVDLYPGGYPARFGRFSGGIVDGEALPPSKELHGEYNVRLFDAGAMVETPFDNGKGTVLVGGRYSYTGELLSLLSSNIILNYWDYQARIGYDLTPKDRLSVFSFGSYDYLGQKTVTGTDTLFGTEFHRADVRYDHALENGNIRTAVTLGLDKTELDEGRFLRDRLLGIRTELNLKLARAVTLRAGTDAQLDAYDFLLNSGDLSSSAAAIAAEFPSRTDFAGGVRGDLVIKATPKFEITPGARLDFYTSQGATAIGFDPRLATRLELSKKTRLLSALGIAHQSPSFVIPVPGFQPAGLQGGLQTAVQESLGVEVDLGGSTTATATVFHNGFFNLSDALSVLTPTVSGCAPGTFPTGSLAGDRLDQPTGTGGGCGVNRFPPGTLGPDRSGGGGQAANSTGSTNDATALAVRPNGTAYGAELFLKRKLTSHIGGFLSYTLSRSTRTYDGQTYIASFDRTHVLNAALAFDLGRNWRAGTRVTFYTGLPKAPDPTDPGSTRLEPFFRTDLRLEKRWPLGKKAWISLVAEWLNATLSKESIGTSCTLSGCTETRIGPVTIPSLGVEGGF